MLTHNEIDAFYKRVDNLNLRFPVAVITEATGESKANVSKILNRKMVPSEGFIKRFNQKFPESSRNVSADVPAENLSASAHDSAIRTLELLAESNKILAEAANKQSDANLEQSQANKILAETNRDLSMKVTDSTTAAADQATVKEMTILLIGLREYTTELGALVKRSAPDLEMEELHKKAKKAKQVLDKRGNPAGAHK